MVSCQSTFRQRIAKLFGYYNGFDPAMAKYVIRALQGNATTFNLSSKEIEHVPKSVSRLTNLTTLRLNNNLITSLPEELLALQHLVELNLGNNALKEIPCVLGHLKTLKKVYLFRNHITTVPPEVIGGWANLVVLNLNHNHIQTLCPEMKRLSKLEHLSLLDNRLEGIPVEVGHLTKLVEINLNRNKLSKLPQELYNCTELRKLHLARNRLAGLPEGIKALQKLQVLDVAGNRLSMFPVEFHLLSLRELYCEGNQFVPSELLESVQVVELFTLRELAARLVLLEVRNKHSLIHKALPHYPCLASALANGGRCAFCLGPFLTTWLECVHFINLKKDMRMRSSLTVPVRALLCSYKCFNEDGHSFYGVASI